MGSAGVAVKRYQADSVLERVGIDRGAEPHPQPRVGAETVQLVEPANVLAVGGPRVAIRQRQVHAPAGLLRAVLDGKRIRGEQAGADGDPGGGGARQQHGCEDELTEHRQIRASNGGKPARQ